MQTWWQVLSQSGKAEELTNSHRPYGRNKVSLQEIKRIRESGGWVCYCFSYPIYFFTISLAKLLENSNSQITYSSVVLFTIVSKRFKWQVTYTLMWVSSNFCINFLNGLTVMKIFSFVTSAWGQYKVTMNFRVDYGTKLICIANLLVYMIIIDFGWKNLWRYFRISCLWWHAV